MMRKLLCLLLLMLLGAQPAVESKDLPRTPPTEPADALKTFIVRDGFKLELAAAEPLVVDPVAMSFDEEGHLFVVEMRDYSERREERLGRIRMLTDTDGDGRFDKATIYAENLPWPTAVICYGGGIFVGATPDIIFFSDNNDDGVADERKVVFTGFGGTNQRLNVQQLLNSFNWGLDNRIHGANGGGSGEITSPEHPERPPVDIRGRDFSFDPRTFDFRAESGGGQHGLSFDPSGRKFVCSNSHHIQAIMYNLRYSDRNPHYAMPPALVDIAADGPAAEVYRASPEEPWRVIRTKWRVSGLVPGPIEGGGRSAGYFTGATGVTIFRGDAWGPQYIGEAFIGDAGGNLVHRKQIRADGLAAIAQRPADEQKREFIACKDNWFRPVQFANGPDGNLYICDMYREVIEHPWSLPESIKKHLDLNSGNDRGRIFRIVKDGVKRPGPARLGDLSAAQLVALLEHPNGWHRETASRLLFQRRHRWAIEPLIKLLRTSPSPYGRVHALHALDGMDLLRADLVAKGLEDKDAMVRRHALRLSEKFAGDPQAVSVLASKFVPLLDDPDVLVRYQLAFTLGEFSYADRNEMLANLIRRDGKDRWIAAAVFSSLAGGSSEVFSILFSDKQFRSSQQGREYLHQLAVMIGSRDRAAEVTQLCRALTETNDQALVFPLARGLGEGLARQGRSLRMLPELKPLVAAADKVASHPASAEPLRLEAIQLLGLTADKKSQEGLLRLLDHPLASVQSAALAALDRLNTTGLAEMLISRWAKLTPRTRSDVLGVLLKRPDRCEVLLDAIEAGEVRRGDLSSTHISFLRNHPNRFIREAASKILADAPIGTRKKVVDALMPALDLRGDPARGKVIFHERCASCHRMGTDGFALGPDLETVKNAGKEKLLVNILDPNREVPTQYSAYLVETKDGDTMLGIIASETASSITLRQAYGAETVIFRSNIKRLKNQGESLMPEGLEEGLKPQGLADLLDFIIR